MTERGAALDISTDMDGGVTVAHPVGELDAFNASEFRVAMEQVTSSSRLVIDLAGVPFVDSAGLGAVIAVIRRVQELGSEIALACPRPALAQLLDHTGVSRIVLVTATVDEAIAALA